MKHIIILLLITLSFQLKAQQKFKLDYNQDDKQDSVVLYKNSDYLYKTILIDFVNLKNKTIIHYEKELYKGDFFDIITLPIEANNSVVRRFFLENVFYSTEKTSMDESLKWLLETYLNKKTRHNTIYDLKLTYTPLWMNKLPDLPSCTYNYVIEPDKISDGLEKELISRLKLPKYSFISYIGSNHIHVNEPTNSHYKSSVINKDITLFYTMHGIVINHKEKYSWAFINDGKVSEGQTHLSLPSIEKVLFYKRYIIVSQRIHQSGIKRVYLVDYEKGYCYRLAYGLIGHFRDINIEDKHLVLKTFSKSKLLNLDTIINKLEK